MTEVAIENGADELDFVCNYEAFKSGEVEVVKENSRGY
jgi:deoxyribose-phosphate aldolase